MATNSQLLVMLTWIGLTPLAAPGFSLQNCAEALNAKDMELTNSNTKNSDRGPDSKIDLPAKSAIDLSSFQNEKEQLEIDPSFRHAFVEVFKNTESGVSILLKNDPALIKKGIALVVEQTLRGSNVDDASLKKLIGAALTNYERYDIFDTNRVLPKSLSADLTNDPTEEIAFYHFVGDKDISSRIQLSRTDTNLFYLNVKKSPRLIGPEFMDEWISFSEKNGLRVLPMGNTIRIPNRIFTNHENDLAPLKAFMSSLLGNFQNNPEVLKDTIEMEFSRIQRAIVADLYLQNVHWKVGMPGPYHDLSKDFSMKIRSALEKTSRIIRNHKDLQELITEVDIAANDSLFGFLKASHKDAFNDAVAKAFNDLSTQESEIIDRTLNFRLNDQRTGKEYRLSLGFRYRYIIDSNDHWRIQLVTTGGITNDIFLSLHPLPQQDSTIPSAAELDQLSLDLQAPIESLLDFEKLRNQA